MFQIPHGLSKISSKFFCCYFCISNDKFWLQLWISVCRFHVRMEQLVLARLTPMPANVRLASTDTTATKVCKHSGQGEWLKKNKPAVPTTKVFVFVSAQCVWPPTVVATKMGVANISAESFQIVPMCVSVLQDINLTATTARASLKVICRQ